ncbi:cytochrome c oxidase assembly factor Coa1 family protein [Sinomicrobium sp. M5D2P9]
MDNQLIEHKSWWKRNWKWLAPACGMALIAIYIFFSSGASGVTSDIVQAYNDTDLYENALKKAASDPRVKDLLGEMEPIDKMAIIEGQVQYGNNNNTVHSTIRINGSKGKARMDISANKVNNEWSYSKITIRIKNPPEKRQTIEIKMTE